MHIIITDSKFSRVRSFDLSLWHGIALFVGLVLLGIGGLWAALQINAKSTLSPASVQTMAAGEAGAASWTGDKGDADQLALRQNIDVLAKRLGVMQARMIQLDALSERLAKLAGLPYKSLEDSPGEGGALIAPRSMTLDQFTSALDDFSLVGDERLALYALLEDALLERKWEGSLTPGRMPVDGLSVGSGFGRRIDPITGQLATHTGVDFPGPLNTPIKATAGGVVVAAHWHAGYGRMIEIDHGNQVITRYAHLKSFKVKVGDLVKPGQEIGLMGSTGRSTGPHLHFEVWVAGRVRNPKTYLFGSTRVAQGP
jgi:murein DD-endopeptidase MepM/ murein hydrolase activator NlpD